MEAYAFLLRDRKVFSIDRAKSTRYNVNGTERSNFIGAAGSRRSFVRCLIRMERSRIQKD